MTLRARRSWGSSAPHRPATREQGDGVGRIGKAADHDTPRDRVTELVSEHAGDVLAYLERRTDPESAADIMSETYIAMWRRAAQIPPDATQARMWMFVTARNALANHRRGQRRAQDLVQRLREELIAAHRPARAANPTTTGSEQEDTTHEAVRDAIRVLRPVQAEVVMLVHWDGFSLAEAAQVMGVTASTARGRYSAARRELALRLGPALKSAGDPQNTVLR